MRSGKPSPFQASETPAFGDEGCDQQKFQLLRAQEAPVTDRITILTSVNGRHAAKQFKRNPKTGEIQNRSYDRERHFRVEEIEISDITDLAAALTRLAKQPHDFVIRGRPLPGINRKYARRLLHRDPRTGDEATFEAVPRHWLPIDLDHVPAGALVDPVNDPNDAIEYLVGLLPPELHDATCWWQFTSSQSLPGHTDTLSARLWFWSEALLDDATLKRWAAVANRDTKLIDPALFSPVQPHYVASPSFEGMSDPLPVRCGLRRGLEESVALIIPPADVRDPEQPGTQGYEPGAGVHAYLAQIGGPEGFRLPIIRAVGSYISIYGSRADTEPLKAAVRAAIARGAPGNHTAEQIERYCSNRYLDDLISWTREQHGDQPPKGDTPEPPLGFDEPPPAEEEFGPKAAEFSDHALAQWFTRTYAPMLRHVAAWGKWMVWAETRWKIEETLLAFNLARVICSRAITLVPPHLPKLAAAVASAKTIAAVERIAKADRQHAMTTQQWDVDIWALNRSDCTTDLRTGTDRPHRRQDYITKSTACGAGGDCPQWRAFLDRITAGDQELQRYLQRVSGYCLTGSIREQVMFFLYGDGNNGKGLFVNTLTAIWLDYAVVAPMETFIECHGERHPTELAHLRGARLVTAQETEQGRRWSETKLKALTGGDPIPARFMRGDFFTYMPEFKLLITGNHKPSLRSVDVAIRRRLHLIPFVVTIPKQERDPELFDKLKTEWPGILQWAIEGCQEWHRIGLAPPPAVLAATNKYFAEEDAVSRWIEDCCVTGRVHWGIGARLWDSWRAWSETNREWTGTRKSFAQTLEKHGFPPEKSQEIRGYKNIDLRPLPEPEP